MQRAIIRVQMARDGYIPLEVEGNVYSDDVEIDAIRWPGGGEVANHLIKDIGQVMQAFADEVESASECAWIDSAELYRDAR